MEYHRILPNRGIFAVECEKRRQAQYKTAGKGHGYVQRTPAKRGTEGIEEGHRGVTPAKQRERQVRHLTLPHGPVLR